MEERQVTIDGSTYKLDIPFTVFATQNPIEHEGTYKLPEAQLDRFLFKVEMDYPLPEEEIKILLDLHSRKNINDLNLIQPIFTKETLMQFREKVRTAHLDEKVASYITQIVNKTRNNSDLYLGGSPRASISIMISAKAIAAISGRDFVTPDDVKMVVYPTLRHRILLTPEKEMEGKTPDDIIKTILERVEVPR